MAYIEPLTDEEIAQLEGAIHKCLQLIAKTDKEQVKLLPNLKDAIEAYNEKKANLAIMKLKRNASTEDLQRAYSEYYHATGNMDGMKEYMRMLKAHKGNLKVIVDNAK